MCNMAKVALAQQQIMLANHTAARRMADQAGGAEVGATMMQLTALHHAMCSRCILLAGDVTVHF